MLSRRQFLTTIAATAAATQLPGPPVVAEIPPVMPVARVAAPAGEALAVGDLVTEVIELSGGIESRRYRKATSPADRIVGVVGPQHQIITYGPAWVATPTVGTTVRG